MATAPREALPLLIFPSPSAVAREGNQSFPPTVVVPTHARQVARIGPRLAGLQTALDNRRLELRRDAQNEDPDLVLVLELIGSLQDFISSAMRVPGLDWLFGADEKLQPDDDFYDTSDPERNLSGKLFLVATNRTALQEILRLWNIYSRDPAATLGKGLEAWKQAFRNLKDARFWGPEDRLGSDLANSWRFRIDAGEAELRFEIEAWHYHSVEKNQKATTEIRALVNQLGGRVQSESLHDAIAYHGFLVSMPAQGVSRLLSEEPAPLLKSDRVMFLRPHGQLISRPPESLESHERTQAAPSNARVDGAPVVGLLDGLPVANHPLLAGRIIVDDPDSWEDGYAVDSRQHGTAMASLIIHGDLNARESPLRRPIYARPIMLSNQHGGEQTPDDRLLVDLVHEAVRRMFEGSAESPPAAPHVKVINLALGDSFRVFAGELSPWAKLLDWLQHKYKVLFIVSAGNHPEALLLDVPAGTIGSLPIGERSAIAIKALCADSMYRSVLSPAESINALTVGAIHSDTSTCEPIGGRFLLFSDGGITPYSSIGPGFRRSIKPDILLPGGRVLYREAPISPPGQTSVVPIHAALPPGQLVAAPPNASGVAIHCRGSSNACALGTRWAARAHAVIEELRAGNASLTDDYDAVLIKALLAHGADTTQLQQQILSARNDVQDPTARRRLTSRYLGLGPSDVERALTCTEQRATLIGVGSLKNEKAWQFDIPIPEAFNARVVRRRITATLAWMSPVNARHSKYRIGRLWLDVPNGGSHGDRVQGEWRQLRLGTIHHEVFEASNAMVVNEQTSIPLRVNCIADAGKLDGPVLFALCVSIEVGAGVNIPVYEQVRNRVRARVDVRAS